MVKGSIFLALLILFWESSAMIVKFIFTSGKEVPFENPLFLTYISSSLFVLYLVPLGIKWMYLKRQKRIELA